MLLTGNRDHEWAPSPQSRLWHLLLQHKVLQSNIVPQTMTQLCSFCRVCSRDTDPTREKTERKCAQTTKITYSECKYRVKRVLLTLRLTTISRLVRIGRGIQGIQSSGCVSVTWSSLCKPHLNQTCFRSWRRILWRRFVLFLFAERAAAQTWNLDSGRGIVYKNTFNSTAEAWKQWEEIIQAQLVLQLS